MLLEDEAVDAVVAFVVARVWTIKSTTHANRSSDDIDVLKDGQRRLVEATGPAVPGPPPPCVSG
jgi:hypothetical protein